MATSGPMVRALAAALGSVPVQPRDKAAVQLARRYAQLLDEARNLPLEGAIYSDLGPKFLAVLTALGMTAAGRGAKGGAPGVAPVTSKLDELRAKRAQRAGQHGA